MRIATRVAGVLLAAGALGGLGSLAATANADTPAQPSATAGHAASQVGAPLYSRGFHIYNLTTSPMTLKSITGDMNFEGNPDVGSVVQPGQFADFEVQYRWLSDQNDEITYSNADGSFKADLEVDGFKSGAPSSKCTVSSGRDVCSDPDDMVNGTNGTTISYLMPRPTCSRDEAFPPLTTACDTRRRSASGR